jgi:hypothetical protein
MKSNSTIKGLMLVLLVTFFTYAIAEAQDRTFGFFTETEAHMTVGNFWNLGDQVEIATVDLNESTWDTTSTEQVFEGTKSMKIYFDGSTDETRINFAAVDVLDLFKISYGELKFQVYLVDTMDIYLEIRGNKNNGGVSDGKMSLTEYGMDMEKTGEWQEIVIDLSQEFDGDIYSFEEYGYISLRNDEAEVGTFYMDNMYIVLPPEDTEAPAFARGYPSVTSVVSERAVLSVWIEEVGTVYNIVKEATETAPTAEELLATDAIPVRKTDGAIQFEVIGLKADTEQAAYFITEDRLKNTSDVITITFNTEPYPEADYEIMKTTTPIDISSSIDPQWDGVDAISLGQVVYGGDAIADENDLSANAKFLWDDINLYALLEVIDDNIFAEPEGDPIGETYGFYTETEAHKTGGDFLTDTDLSNAALLKVDGKTHSSRAGGIHEFADSSYFDLNSTEVTPVEGNTSLKIYQHGNKNGEIGFFCDRTGALKRLNNGKLTFHIYLVDTVDVHMMFRAITTDGDNSRFRDVKNSLHEEGLIDMTLMNQWQKVEIDFTEYISEGGLVSFEEFESFGFYTDKWSDADNWAFQGTFYVDDIHIEYEIPMITDNVGFFLDINNSKHTAGVTAMELPNNESVEVALFYGQDTNVEGSNLVYTPEIVSFANAEENKYYVQAALNWASLGLDYQPAIGHDKYMGLDITVEDNDAGNFAESKISAFNGTLAKYDLSNYGVARLVDPSVSTSNPGNIIENVGLRIYPNPTSSFLSIENNYKSLIIYDMTGKSIYQSTDNAMKTLNVSNLKEGVYIISLMDMDNQRLFGKFVKQ